MVLCPEGQLEAAIGYLITTQESETFSLPHKRSYPHIEATEAGTQKLLAERNSHNKCPSPKGHLFLYRYTFKGISPSVLELNHRSQIYEAGTHPLNCILSSFSTFYSETG